LIFPGVTEPCDRSQFGGHGLGHTGGQMGSGVPKAIMVVLSSTDADGVLKSEATVRAAAVSKSARRMFFIFSFPGFLGFKL
jgi:hypothetical protein